MILIGNWNAEDHNQPLNRSLSIFGTLSLHALFYDIIFKLNAEQHLHRCSWYCVHTLSLPTGWKQTNKEGSQLPPWGNPLTIHGELVYICSYFTHRIYMNLINAVTVSFIQHPDEKNVTQTPSLHPVYNIRETHTRQLDFCWKDLTVFLGLACT